MSDAMLLPQFKKSSSDPLKDWPNDDLLLKEKARQNLTDSYPRAFRVLDWANLRDQFKKYDLLANESKTKINRHGGRGALLSAMGASLLALAPLFPASTVQKVIVVVGCGLVLIGGMMGLWHLLIHSGRVKWLLNRVWTERLRQFHFQYLINNLDAAIAAMDDDDKLEEYRSLRDDALETFISDTNKDLSARGPIKFIRWLAADHIDDRVWGQQEWRTIQVNPNTDMTENHRNLFKCLSKLRIGIQEYYSGLQLKPGTASQGNIARLITVNGNIATLIFVVSLTVAGMAILFYPGPGVFLSDIMIAISGIAAAWGLFLRLVDQGMGYSLDAERYGIYAERVGVVRKRFDAAGDSVIGHIAALRELEIYTYREMRQFLRTHLQSRFLG